MHKEANLTLTLSRSRSIQDHYLNKLNRPHIPDATYQVPRSPAFWFWRRRFLKGFYHIWAWRPSWSCDQDHLNKLFCSPILKSLHMKFEFNWPSGFRGEDVWKCWRTDDGVIGILIAHPGAFDSGELIKRCWSVWGHAQAGLRLYCSQTHEDRFSRVKARIR